MSWHQRIIPWTTIEQSVRRRWSISSANSSSSTNCDSATTTTSLLTKLCQLLWQQSPPRTGGGRGAGGGSDEALLQQCESGGLDLPSRIQKRVQERDGWLVHGALPTFPTGTSHWAALPQFLRYQPPSQPILDRDFPLVYPMDWQLLQSSTMFDEIRLTWLGHSSLLVQLGGNYNLLTDPAFSERCSPFQWIGPKRYRPPPCRMSDLLDNIRIDAVLISHNHYDHLDYTTVCEIARRDEETQFIVPLGLKSWFETHVLGRTSACSGRIVELDWHESVQLNNKRHSDNGTSSNITITGLPARHWSNRIGDLDASLWCGYSVVHNNSSSRFYFAGDTAWWDDVETLGRQYGPFDVAAIPIGAYEPWVYMKANHVNVEEAVAMKDALKAKAAVPIHWGTFPLTVEPAMEPKEKLIDLMANRVDKDSFTAWRIGETKRFQATGA